MKSPSALLSSTAEPFDSACMKVRHLEDAAINMLLGRDWHRLDAHESKLCTLLVEFGLIKVNGGYVERI